MRLFLYFPSNIQLSFSGQLHESHTVIHRPGLGASSLVPLCQAFPIQVGILSFSNNLMMMMMIIMMMMAMIMNVTVAPKPDSGAAD